jgi:hypothetical protein
MDGADKVAKLSGVSDASSFLRKPVPTATA